MLILRVNTVVFNKNVNNQVLTYSIVGTDNF